MKFFNNVGVFDVFCMTSKPYECWYVHNDSIMLIQNGISDITGIVFDEGMINVSDKSIQMKYKLAKLHSLHYRNKLETKQAFKLFDENIDNYTFEANSPFA